MKNINTRSDCDLLIIGNGFSGRTIAGAVDRDTIIVERGEKIDIFRRRQQFLENKKSQRRSAKMRSAYASKHDFNQPEDLGKDCASRYILVDGGCSNHWGGLSFRLTQSVFDDPIEGHEWPFSYSDVVPYYARAEQLLRICADPKDPDNRNAVSSIQGGDIWREALDRYFPAAYFGSQAHDLSTEKQSDQGTCLGAGDCALCPFDAKTRAAHLRVDHRIINETVVRSLVFDGDKAVKAICESKTGWHEIHFDEVVIAAHGVESLKILWNSILPNNVPAQLVGRYYQDHAVAQLACKLPGTTIPYLQANTNTQVVIPELSGQILGVEYTTLGLMGLPRGKSASQAIDVDMLNRWDVEEAIKELGSVLNLYVLLEIAPLWNLSMSYTDGKLDVDSSGYHRQKKIYESIISEIYSRLSSLGAEIIGESAILHYRRAYGTHHLMGTLNMSKGSNGVVDKDFRLKGTPNVYVAGSSLFPRCGSRNPTLTVVALSLMLSELLKRSA